MLGQQSKGEWVGRRRGGGVGGIKSSQKVSVSHHKAVGDFYLAMGAAPCPINPIGALHRHHYCICDFTKSVQEKHTSSHWPIDLETLCMNNL